MERVIQIGDSTITYHLRRSRRAKRLILRVDHVGAVEVVVPQYVAYRFGETFLHQRIDWVRRMQGHQHGGLGLRSPLPEPVKSLVKERYQKQAQGYFEALVAEMVQKLGVAAPRIAIRDFRSQWGSCNRPKNLLTFSWRLMAAPAAAARYVAAHEAAHLVHANHGKEFWGVVESLDPDFREGRAWLKQHGAGLRV
ncbi:MAG: YgjP-like metallopeptidase domain-containing protein [Patescibacteria group bacterium]